MLNLNLTPPAHIKEVYTFSYIEAHQMEEEEKRKMWDPSSFITHPPIVS
jgi:hypothetical protein